MREVSRRLRRETADAHAAIERVALATRFLDDPVAYGRYLAALHGFYAGVEDALARVPDLERWLPDLTERRKAPWLAEDLRALDVGPLAPMAASYPDVASALGAGYVVEGATLGGRWILAHLAPGIPSDARRFFTGYGAATRSRFVTYCHAVEQHAHQDRIVSAAVQTFRSMQAWLEAAFPA